MQITLLKKYLYNIQSRTSIYVQQCLQACIKSLNLFWSLNSSSKHFILGVTLSYLIPGCWSVIFILKVGSPCLMRWLCRKAIELWRNWPPTSCLWMWTRRRKANWWISTHLLKKISSIIWIKKVWWPETSGSIKKWPKPILPTLIPATCICVVMLWVGGCNISTEQERTEQRKD